MHDVCTVSRGAEKGLLCFVLFNISSTVLSFLWFFFLKLFLTQRAELEWVQPSHLERSFVCALHPKQMRDKASKVPGNSTSTAIGKRHFPLVPRILLSIGSVLKHMAFSYCKNHISCFLHCNLFTSLLSNIWKTLSGLQGFFPVLHPQLWAAVWVLVWFLITSSL